ncbi:hypothetical protein XENOCAPTIV_030730 [Xenoophorus captivus]|uniref:Uncharacterized protein n=1 Tax=Xenoophorus captivus TaxID=1517983 RepID=A0ABV0S1F9_9TELE
MTYFTCLDMSRLCRCGVSSQALEEGMGVALTEALVGLPAEVKLIGSQTDNVVPLEELAMRTMHRIYHHRPAGGDRPLTSKPCSPSSIPNFSPSVTRRWLESTAGQGKHHLFFFSCPSANPVLSSR